MFVGVAITPCRSLLPDNFLPTNIANLVAWYDASDTTTITHSGGAVSQWNDKSGNGNHATQANASGRPITGTRTINGLNTLDFDTINKSMDLPAGLLELSGGSWTYLAVVATDNASASQRIIAGMNAGNMVHGLYMQTSAFATSRQGGTGLNAAATGALSTNVSCIAGRRLGATLQAYRDGSLTSASIGTAVNVTSTSMSLSQISAGQLDGRIAEILMFSQSISDADYNSAVAYLAAKWGFTNTALPTIANVVTRAGPPSTYVAQSGSLAGAECQQEASFIAGTTTNNLRFTWANWSVNTGGVSRITAGQYSFTLKASVTVAGVNYPINWGGTQTKTFAVDEVMTSDVVVLPADITPGQEIKVRWWIVYSTAPTNWPLAIRYNDNGWNEFGTGLVDKINSTTDYFTRQTNLMVLPPIAIRGTVSGSVKSVEILGDSISSDGADDSYALNTGYVPKALTAGGYAFINNGASGNSIYLCTHTASGATADEIARRKIAHHSNITHVLCGLSTNDFASGRTAANILADLATLKTYLDGIGVKLIPFTCPPRTNSANNAERTAGEWAKIASFNASIVSNNGVGYGYFDANLNMRDSGNNNLWRTDLGTPTADGIHPNPVIHTALNTALQAALPGLLA